MKIFFCCFFSLSLLFGNAQGYLLLNNIDSTLNLPDTISSYVIIINDADSIPENKKIRNLDFLKNKVVRCSYFRITNSLLTEISEIGNGSGMYSLLIQNNGYLKKVTDLKTMTRIAFLEISYNFQLDTIRLQLDSLYFATQYRFYGNQSLKSLDLNFNKISSATLLGDGPGREEYNFSFKIYNHDSLEAIKIKTKNRVVTVLDIQGNQKLKSIDINKLKYDDSLQLRQYEFDYWYLNTKRTSTNIFLIDNASLTHFGGFEKDSFTLCSSRILKNPKLKDLCILKNHLINFNIKDVDPKKVFLIDSNGIGASSLEEVKTKSCDSVNSEITSTSSLWSIYPNPATEFISIKGISTENHHAEWQVTDVMGKTQSVSVIQDRIDIQQLTPGTYYLKLQDYSFIGNTMRFVKY